LPLLLFLRVNDRFIDVLSSSFFHREKVTLLFLLVTNFLLFRLGKIQGHWIFRKEFLRSPVGSISQDCPGKTGTIIIPSIR